MKKLGLFARSVAIFVTLGIKTPLFAADAPTKKLPACPPDWKVEIIAEVPTIHSPSVLCCAPDGRLFVGEDRMDMDYVGNKPNDRVLCFHPDGHVTVFADHLYAVFGIQYIDGKVYIHHTPKFSVFTDDNGVGKNRIDLIDVTNPNPWNNGEFNDHIPANMHLAMDGYLYMSTGDKGIYGAVSNVDGSKAEIKGGGVLRIRPDGTDMEVYSTGTRNHLDISINAEDEIFSYDNTDDGLGWWTRFTHMVDGGFYGYPYDYRPLSSDTDAMAKYRDEKGSKPNKPYTLWRIDEFGGGSPCGAIGYNEDALPPEYRGNLFHCEWGKGTLERFIVERSGGTYKIVKRELFLQRGGGSELRPLGVTVQADGMGFYVADWNFGGWRAKAEAGRLIKLTYTGKSQATPKPTWYIPAAQAQPFTATTAELIAGLSHPAQSVRLVAQRRVAERPKEAVAQLIALLNDAKAPAYAKWSAIWTVDRIDNGRPGRDAIIAILKDEKAETSVKIQAARQLGTRRAKDATQALIASLNDIDASMRFRAATALGRIGDLAAVPPLIEKLSEKDFFAHYSVFTALNRIGRANPSAWEPIVKALSSYTPEIRDGAAYAMRETYDLELVKQLSIYIENPANPVESRAAAITALAPLRKMPKPWDGRWWGTQPQNGRPPAKELTWAGTELATIAARTALKDSSPIVRLAAVEGLQIAPDPALAEILTQLFQNEKEIPIRKAILKALVASKVETAGAFIGGVLKDPKANAELIPDAIALARQVGSSASTEAIRNLAAVDVDSTILIAAIDALGALKDADAINVLTQRLKHQDEKVVVASAKALGGINRDASVTALIASLKDARSTVRRAAATSLGAIKSPAAIDPLLACYKDPDMQKEAINALASIPDLRALDAYLEGLASRDAQLRDQCRKAIAAIHDKALPLIETRLDTNPLPTDVIAELQKIYSVYMSIREWQIIGPFANPTAEPIDIARPDLTKPLKAVDDRLVKWRKMTGDAADGMIDLGNAMKPNNATTAYAVTTIDSKEDREVEFSVGSDDTITLWLNGQKILEELGDHGWNPNQYNPRGALKKGKNLLVAKCSNNAGPWQFSVGVTGERQQKLFLYDTKKLAPEAFAAFASSHTGNPENGHKIFALENGAGCIKCHKVASDGGEVGPALTGIATKYDKSKLIESVLFPSRQILDGYQQTIIRTKSGDIQAGVVKAETDTDITLVDSGAQKIVIKKSDIGRRRFSDISVMPEGLHTGLKPEEFADLISYLETLKEKPADTPKK